MIDHSIAHVSEVELQHGRFGALSSHTERSAFYHPPYPRKLVVTNDTHHLPSR